MDAPFRVLQKGTNVAPAPLKRQTTGTLYRDGETITAASMSNRMLTLAVLLDVSFNPASANSFFAELFNELNSARNTLVWALPGTASITFNTWRAPDSKVISQEWGLGLHNLELNIPADPLGVGSVILV